MKHWKKALLDYSEQCDKCDKKTKEDGAIIMSIMWLWCQKIGYNENQNKEVQKFLGKHLPAEFLYGGFSSVVQRMFKEFNI